MSEFKNLDNKMVNLTIWIVALMILSNLFFAFVLSRCDANNKEDTLKQITLACSYDTPTRKQLMACEKELHRINLLLIYTMKQLGLDKKLLARKE